MADSPSRDDADTSYKRSFWKTTGAAALATTVILWLAMATAPSFFSVVAALLAGLGVVMTLAGVVVLYRDYRDDRGMPDLFWVLLNASRPGGPGSSARVRRPFRFLFGSSLRPGDLVAVRPAQEILATLDEDGRTNGLPFMPEMVASAGRRFRIHRRIDKINDMIQRSGRRRVDDAVTLEGVRCDGALHGGCQAECQIIWHESWLRPTSGGAVHESQPGDAEATAQLRDLTERAAVREATQPAGATTYMCQITELREASHPMSSRDVRQDLRPLVNGTVGLRAWLVAVLTRLFNHVQRLRGGAAYPAMPPQLSSRPTPSETLGLQPGEEVQIRNKHEISRTLFENHNRGMWFGTETVRFCKQRARVKARVESIINERTGEMLRMKTPCIMLGDTMATGEYLRFCPQNEPVFWREIWLRRSQGSSAS